MPEVKIYLLTYGEIVIGEIDGEFIKNPIVVGQMVNASGIQVGLFDKFGVLASEFKIHKSAIIGEGFPKDELIEQYRSILKQSTIITPPKKKIFIS